MATDWNAYWQSLQDQQQQQFGLDPTQGNTDPSGYTPPTANALPATPAPPPNGRPPTPNTGIDPTQTQPNNVGTGPNDASGNPIQTSYNQNLFATDQQAQQLAQQYGGTVMSDPLREAGGGTPGSPFTMPNANYIKLANGSVVNAGQIEQWQQAGRTDLIQNEIQNGLGSQGNPGGQTGASNWYQQYDPSGVGKSSTPTTPTNAQKSTIPPVQPSQQNPQQTGLPDSPAGGNTSTSQGNTQTSDPSNPTLTHNLLTGGYGVGDPGAGAGGGNLSIGNTPNFTYKNSNNVGDIVANDRSYAYAQGQNLIAGYGDIEAQQNQRARQLGSLGDSMYGDLYQNPGYTADQASGITNQAGLNSLNWTDQMAQDNQLNSAEKTGITGDPNAALNTYNGQVENLRQDARNYQGNLQGVYDTGATNLNTATGQMAGALDKSIDPSQLGLSDEYKQNYNFGPDQQQAMIEDAGRTVGQGTAATTDQLQRQANAAGTNAPLAMAAALDRERQTGAVASADAMTKAKIQAAQLGLQTEQSKEQTRLGSAQDIASRQQSAATTVGQADEANQQYLTGGRASSALQTGQAYLTQQNELANQQTSLTGTAELAQQQRAQAMAQNRQQTNQANQASQFSRGSYQDTAASQRATQLAGATRADQTTARSDVRQQGQQAYDESNSQMAGQLQAFTGVTGAGQASQSNAIKAAQLPTTLDKVIGAASGAATAFADGGWVDQPTMAKLGERGPEIVIKLKPSGGGPMSYRRRNEPAYA